MSCLHVNIPASLIPVLCIPSDSGLVSQTARPYHVRVLIPCYNESLEIVGKTAMAALDAMMPVGCERTVYICDDGKDATKRKW